MSTNRDLEQIAELAPRICTYFTDATPTQVKTWRKQWLAALDLCELRVEEWAKERA